MMESSGREEWACFFAKIGCVMKVRMQYGVTVLFLVNHLRTWS
jgi:hypothetical protein